MKVLSSMNKKVCAHAQTMPSQTVPSLTRDGRESLLRELEGYRHLEAFDPNLGYTHHARVANCLWQLYSKTTELETKAQYLSEAESEIHAAVLGILTTYSIAEFASDTEAFTRAVTDMSYIELNQLEDNIDFARKIYAESQKEDPFANIKLALTPFLINSEPLKKLLKQYHSQSQETGWGILSQMVVLLLESCQTVESAAIKVQRLRAAEEFSVKSLEMRPCFIDALINQCTIYHLLQRYSQTEEEKVLYLRKGLEAYEAPMKIFKKLGVPSQFLGLFQRYVGEYDVFLSVNRSRRKPIKHTSRSKLLDLQWDAIDARGKNSGLKVK